MDGVSGLNMGKQVSKFLDGKLDAIGFEGMTANQKCVYLVLLGKAMVDNGGFRYFMETKHRLEDLANALDAVGLSELGEVCRKALSRFPERRTPEDRNERIRVAAEIDIALEDKELEVFWSFPMDEVYLAVSFFARAHPREFGLTTV